jgi:hypothetical protein
VYARPTTEGQPTTLGVSGMLWRDALVMYDRATRSLWSQVNGKAVAGPMKGEKLEEVPSELTTWGTWKRRHPDTLVLAKPKLAGSPYEEYFADPEQIGVRGSKNRDRRLPGKMLVLGLEADGKFAAAPLPEIEKRGVMNTTALGLPLVVTTAGVFDRRVEGRVLSFERVDLMRLRDRETGSIWSSESGEATEGVLGGSRLRRLSAKVAYWGVWVQFHPQSEIIRGE